MRWWTITVTGYGSFEHYGTRNQAENVARGKAEWEGGRWSLKEANEIETNEGIGHVLWRKQNGYPLERWEREALRAAETQNYLRRSNYVESGCYWDLHRRSPRAHDAVRCGYREGSGRDVRRHHDFSVWFCD